MKQSVQKWEQSILPYISLGTNAVFSDIRSVFCSLSLLGKQALSTLRARHVGTFASLSCCNWLIIEDQIVSKILSAPLAWIPPKCFTVPFSSLKWLVLLALLSALSVHPQIVYTHALLPSKSNATFAWWPQPLRRLGYGVGSHCSGSQHQEEQTEQAALLRIQAAPGSDAAV